MYILGQQRAAEDITKSLILSINALYYAGILYVIAVTHAITLALVIIIYHIARKFGELTIFEYWGKKVWPINRSANRLLIESTNLDGFSLVVNHGRFTKFATKLSHYMVCSDNLY